MLPRRGTPSDHDIRMQAIYMHVKLTKRNCLCQCPKATSGHHENRDIDHSCLIAGCASTVDVSARARDRAPRVWINEFRYDFLYRRVRFVELHLPYYHDQTIREVPEAQYQGSTRIHASMLSTEFWKFTPFRRHSSCWQCCEAPVDDH